MALSNTQYDAIMCVYSERQNRHRREHDEHMKTAYKRIPQLSMIDKKIAEVSIAKARAHFQGVSDSTDLSEIIQELSDQRKILLVQHGFPEDYLDMKYDCHLCKDTGYHDNQKCFCFKKAEIELLYDQSNIRDILREENFEHCNLSYYSKDLKNQATQMSSYETARLTFKRCHQFVMNFDSSFENLFFYGDTGVGKTFFSHCIAKELIDRSYCVIYFTAFDLFDLFARNTFSTTSEAREVHNSIFDCDLLILDDLGTELTNSFVSSQLFLCINERMLRKKSTIISTNLSLNKFAETYSERTFSRISSNYTMIKLFGNDIRIQKKLMEVQDEESGI
ncbi:ATP-binding protein [Blautia liquoris]|uniref:ATP-binding protein n=1 Tax=Blautia liquoris TaxID=2779518 RepID=A0A7M2RIB3_9FIRM|nr:ATP-binding protein [Blautia liquoris]QOV19080.1 ATP-binding protein [Blautia liquoris]